ncbi:MAG TPA: hypothetical protein VGU20_27370 [Stellaceae bacterium]|nr:hypothetical protein [Stellaceae bacterium]
MNRLASAMLALGFITGSAGIALAAAGPAAAPAVGTTAQPAHSAPVKPIDRHQRTDVQGDRMTRALNLLEANGYADFGKFQRSGKNFTATVTRSGQPVTVMVNPDTGKIIRQG